MIDLAELKSRRVLESPEEIAEHLLERQKAHSGPVSGTTPQTTVHRDDDHGVKVYKTLTHERLKAELPESEVRRLTDLRNIPWRAEYVDRVIRQWASDERVDGHGDIVKQNWIFDDFVNNPVMPYNHRWEEPPIGNHLDWMVIKRVDADYTGPALQLLSLFMTADVSAFADSVFRMVAAGFLRMNSVGFVPGKIILIEDDDERATLGLGRWGEILDDNLLLEDSPTTIGANQGALVILEQAKHRGLVRPSDCNAVREMERLSLERGEGDVERWKDLEGHYVQLFKLLFPRAKYEHHKELDEPLEILADDAEEKGTPCSSCGGYVAGGVCTECGKEKKSFLSVSPEGKEMSMDLLGVKLDSMMAILETGLTSLSAMLEDIRELLESGDSDLGTLINGTTISETVRARLEAILSEDPEFFEKLLKEPEGGTQPALIRALLNRGTEAMDKLSGGIDA